MYTKEELESMRTDLEAIQEFKLPEDKFLYFNVPNKYYYEKLMHSKYPNKPKGLHISSYIEIELGKYSSIESRRSEIQKEYRDSHKQEIKQWRAEDYLTNIDYYKEQHRQYKISNKGSINAINARRRAMKKLRIPSWSCAPKIKEIYTNCPEGCHVDHIIPLQGTLVSGLHVEGNLQYLSAQENLKKHNEFDITKFNIGDYNTENIVWPIS